MERDQEYRPTVRGTISSEQSKAKPKEYCKPYTVCISVFRSEGEESYLRRDPAVLQHIGDFWGVHRLWSFEHAATYASSS